MATEFSRHLREVSAMVDHEICNVLDRVRVITGRVAELEHMANDGPITDIELEMLEGIKSRVDALDPTNSECLITDTSD